MLPINRNPSPSELKQFGILLVIFTAAVGSLSLWRTGSSTWPIAILMGGGTLSLVFFAVPAARRSIYVGWMYAMFPIGWIVSHVLLAVIYFGVVTPVAIALRAFGHDALQRKFDRTSRSYWARTTPHGSPETYFKQF